MTDPRASRGTPANLKSYVCIEVFNGERPVLLVSREGGDSCFLCGGEHPDNASFYRVVGTGHPIRDDPTLVEVLDLDANAEAERVAVGATWTRFALVADPNGADQSVQRPCRTRLFVARTQGSVFDTRLL